MDIGLPLTFLYPAAVKDVDLISFTAQRVKIARHSYCTACSCRGMHPPNGWTVITDDSEDAPMVIEQAEDLDELTDDGYMQICACGHGLPEHGADEGTDAFELRRKAKVAVQIDVLLDDAGALLDFSYTTHDVDSFRRQIMLPGLKMPIGDNSDASSSSDHSSPGKRPPQSSSSSLSDLPRKKRRVSYSSSSLSEDDDDEEEDRPLAARTQQPHDTGKKVPQKRAGKKTSGHKTVGGQGPTDQSHQTPIVEAFKNGETNGRKVKKLKPEDVKVNKEQAERLATGVTVDVGVDDATPAMRPEKPAVVEERNGIIRFVVVNNDGSPTSNIFLTGLKVLFQTQLPNMPREYITRLVFDRSSQSMAVVQQGLKVVGGITYRPFPHRTFAEIVFFAISSVYQVSGYGGHLMNHFKMHIRRNMPSIFHFLTYADNYAIGYFKKQGFTKDITLDQPLWTGYIKDYEGGTLMQCSMLPKVDYLNTRDVLSRQRDAIMAKIRTMSKSRTIYSGLKQFKTASAGLKIDFKDVPGLRESGWNPEMDEISRRPVRGTQHNTMQRLLTELQQHPLAWAFLQPVNKDDVLDYDEVIKKAMDFSTMEYKLDNNMYNSLDTFVEDARLVFSNCRTYNNEGSVYAKNAIKMEKFLDEWLDDPTRD